MKNLTGNIGLAVVLGSGLGEAELNLKKVETIPYRKLGIPVYKALEGHKYRADIYASDNGLIAVFRGRVHYYEKPSSGGHLKIVKLAAESGIKKILFTHAAGSLRKDYKVGDWVVIKDHINLTNTNPFLEGALDLRKTDPFRDIRGMYDNELTRNLEGSFKALRIRNKKGVYAGVAGPLYETRAEALFFKKIGADAAGMSLIHEALYAFFLGMECSSLAYITNNLLTGGVTGHKDVVKSGSKAKNALGRIISHFARKI